MTVNSILQSLPSNYFKDLTFHVMSNNQIQWKKRQVEPVCQLLFSSIFFCFHLLHSLRTGCNIYLHVNMRRGGGQTICKWTILLQLLQPPHSLYKSTKTKKENLKSDTSKHFHILLKYFSEEHFFKTIHFYSSNKIRKTQNEYLNIVSQNLNSR